MTGRVLRALAADPAFWYLLAALALIVAALVIVLSASPPKVPCADPFGANGQVVHLWCAPGGVSP